MQYLAWRVMVGLNDEITLSFLIVGHTKFSPDWCFGLLKRAFRRTKVGCLDDIVRVVENSATVNHAQLVGTQSGEVLVMTYDWSEFFSEPYRQNDLKRDQSHAPLEVYQVQARLCLCQRHLWRNRKRNQTSKGHKLETKKRYFTSSNHTSWAIFGEKDISLWENQRVLSSWLSGPRVPRPAQPRPPPYTKEKTAKSVIVSSL